MKAQMSLEMIIGLLILLVVAAVVIQLFLKNTNISNQQYLNAIEYRQFKDKCQSLCSNAQSAGTQASLAQFCYTKLEGAPDLSGTGQKYIQSETKLLDICNDGVYCFMVFPCKRSDSGQIVDWPDCRQILCDAYYDVYKDTTQANTKVKQIFPSGIGTCVLPPGYANWYNLYFGTNPCTEGPTGSTGPSPSPTSATLSCTQASSNSLTCLYSCPNAVSTQNTGSLSISGTNQRFTISQQAGSDTFSNLSPGTQYSVGLTCDPQGSIQTSQPFTLQ